MRTAAERTAVSHLIACHEELQRAQQVRGGFEKSMRALGVRVGGESGVEGVCKVE
jgi:hypothetical protein